MRLLNYLQLMETNYLCREFPQRRQYSVDYNFVKKVENYPNQMPAMHSLLNQLSLRFFLLQL
ncbi:hypothetical protein HMPREF0758_0731 [Serratia odorifera DSM 4582]|uniref:Uncharacterized protein n=1 Tax=Serratia odorifera DSM 4582 TaxID=667129 RepID=D4DXU8_SEROD|nr:hypothetical protein HMPREF0758_0731 [Serratia odorifera DSM 4582]